MATILNIRTATFIVIVLWSQGVSACEKGKSRRHWSDNCCDGEAYILGDESERLIEACDVEPENASLSFTDSLWTAYECIVRKAVGANQLDVKAYADMMSSNLSESKRERIRELVIKGNSAKDHSFETGFAKLKSYRAEYFRTEFEVCKYEGLQTKRYRQNLTNETLKERWLEEWEPSTRCAEGKVPEFLVEYFTNSKENTRRACKVDLEKRYKIAWGHPFFTHIWDLCFCVSMETISVEYVESEDFSFNHVFYNVLPKYWSKDVKASGYTNMLKLLSDWYSAGTKIHDVNSAVSAIRSKFQKKHANVTTGSDPKIGARHFAEKAYIIVALTEAGIEALGQSCLPSDAATNATVSSAKGM